MLLQISNYTDAILSGISFSLEKGKHLVILGANGVGKSTLAKVLCGLIPSEAVRVDDIIPSKVYGEKRVRTINYIPPKLEIYDSYLPVEDFLALSHFNRNLTIDAVLKRVGIAHLKGKPCRVLSSGESQLLLTASALLHGAGYTIFDEPTANLDPVRMRLLFALLKEEKTLPSKLIITHNLDLAYRLGFDILYLYEGEVAFHGRSSEFFEQSHLDRLYDGAVRNIGTHVVTAL